MQQQQQQQQRQQPAGGAAAAGARGGGRAAADCGGGCDAVPSLQHVCMAAAEGLLRADTVCAMLVLADLVRPSADTLRAAALAWLARRLPAVLAADAAGLQDLSFDCMLDLLQHSELVRRRRALPPLHAILTVSALHGISIHVLWWSHAPLLGGANPRRQCD